MMNDTPDWKAIPASQYPFLMNLKRTGKVFRGEQIYYDEVSKMYYYKDSLHGEIEEMDRHGDHAGVLLPDGTRHPKKKKDKTKTIRL